MPPKKEETAEKKPRVYEHPIVILGAGMGGISVALDLKKRGQKNFIIYERCEDFGGTTWREVANKTTKLQTEKGTYHVDYMNPDVAVDPDLKTWPSRDSLRDMFQTSAEGHGLRECTHFHTPVLKVTKNGDTLASGHYKVEVQDNTKDEGETVTASAFIACPGVFYLPNDIKFPGVKDFGGYITHGSFDSLKPKKLKDQFVTIVGHGGFTIENVRTCIEHGSKKISIVCRHRHLSGPKMVSWLVGQTQYPVPGHIFVKSMQMMYDLCGFDVWSHPGVSTDANRTHVLVTQSTSFGVTDIYFLAMAYGLVEIYVDEIAKLSHHCVHTKKGDSIECDALIKCLGEQADPDFDEIVGLQEIRGMWMNSDPLTPILAVAAGVQAKNYASFSLGPGYAGQIKVINWLIDFPEDFTKIYESLPVQKVEKGGGPQYKVAGGFMMLTMSATKYIPELGAHLGEMDQLKAKKTREGHPLEKHMAEVTTEWAYYIKLMKDQGQIAADAPDIPYPYTIENMTELIKAGEQWWYDDYMKKVARYEAAQKK